MLHEIPCCLCLAPLAGLSEELWIATATGFFPLLFFALPCVAAWSKKGQKPRDAGRSKTDRYQLWVWQNAVICRVTYTRVLARSLGIHGLEKMNAILMRGERIIMQDALVQLCSTINMTYEYIRRWKCLPNSSYISHLGRRSSGDNASVESMIVEVYEPLPVWLQTSAKIHGQQAKKYITGFCMRALKDFRTVYQHILMRLCLLCPLNSQVTLRRARARDLPVSVALALTLACQQCGFILWHLAGAHRWKGGNLWWFAVQTSTSTSGPLLPEHLGPWLGAVCCVWTAVLCSRAGILSAPQSWNNKLWTCVKQSNKSHAQSQFLVDATSLCISVQCTVEYNIL